MTYSFYFKDKDKESATLYLLLRNGSKRIVISTGIVENPSSFDSKAVEFTKTNEYYKISNEILAKWKHAASLAIREYDLIEGEKSLEDIKKKILDSMSIDYVAPRKGNSFLQYYQKWSTTSTTKRQATRFSLYSYRLFAEFLNGKSVSFENMNYALVEKYIEWMNQRGLSANTRGSHVKRLKTAMHEAYDSGLHNNLDFQKFRKEQEEVDNVYLDDADLKKLENIDLVGSKQAVRDIFLIGCYTAMRFSDYSRLTQKDIVDGFIYQIQQKTKERVVIPVSPKVQAIMDRYEGKLPPISQQKFNSIIKDVCRAAGIDQIVTILKNGVERKVEKWELVTSHTARRTAATNMFKAGIPAIAIMKITGHRTEENFMKYIKISKEENAQMLKDNPFFK